MSALRDFATAEPERASAYLRSVEGRLRGAGKVDEANTVAALLGQTALVDRIAAHEQRLSAVFPQEASGWGAVQMKRAGTVGYDVREVSAPSFVRGTLEVTATGAVIKTEGGRELKVNTSSHALPEAESLPLTLVTGFVGDGPISFQGTFSEDRASFNLEGFALDLDGSFSTFTFGRTQREGYGVIATSRGPVRIEDPLLEQKLKTLKGLGVILPGEPERRGDELVYTKPSTQFFALARFAGQASGGGPIREATADMALSVFRQKPVRMPESFANRTEHPSRMWLLGDVTLDANHEATSFDATYVSQSAYGQWKPHEPALEADPVQAAVMEELV